MKTICLKNYDRIHVISNTILFFNAREANVGDILIWDIMVSKSIESYEDLIVGEVV